MAVGYAFMLDVMTTLALTALAFFLTQMAHYVLGGIKTESTLHSSTAYRTQTACHWHITAFGKQTMPAVIFANGFARALERVSFVRDGASCRCPEQRRGESAFPSPRLQSNLASWPVVPGFMSAMKQGCGRCPRTLKPARCEGHKHIQNLWLSIHDF